MLNLNGNPSINHTPDQATLRRNIWKRAIQILVIFLVLAALLFLAAGRLDWGMAWAYLAIYVVNVAVNTLVLLPRNPELIAERAETKADSKTWDKSLSLFIGAAMLASLVVAGLQVRFGWSPALPLAIQLVALLLTVLAQALFSWAMICNPFFSRTVRIQTDRGQTVITNGPYHYVRHPGYTGMVFSMLTTPIMLGSLWALIPGAVAAVLYVVRTVLEDRTLQNELIGYPDYAQKVRYRLLPGVW